jgi:hypothetical protein
VAHGARMVDGARAPLLPDEAELVVGLGHVPVRGLHEAREGALEVGRPARRVVEGAVGAAAARAVAEAGGRVAGRGREGGRGRDCSGGRVVVALGLEPARDGLDVERRRPRRAHLPLERAAVEVGEGGVQEVHGGRVGGRGGRGGRGEVEAEGRAHDGDGEGRGRPRPGRGGDEGGRGGGRRAPLLVLRRQQRHSLRYGRKRRRGRHVLVGEEERDARVRVVGVAGVVAATAGEGSDCGHRAPFFRVTRSRCAAVRARARTAAGGMPPEAREWSGRLRCARRKTGA